MVSWGSSFVEQNERSNSINDIKRTHNVKHLKSKHSEYYIDLYYPDYMKSAKVQRREKLLKAVISSIVKLKKKIIGSRDYNRRDELYEKLKELNKLRREPILKSTTEEFKRLRKRNKDTHTK